MGNIEEGANALGKVANLIGKKTLVMWCIVTTFTTGYLYFKTNDLQDKRLTEMKEANDKLVAEIRNIKATTEETKLKVDSTIPKLDTTILNVKQTLDKINNK